MQEALRIAPVPKIGKRKVMATILPFEAKADSRAEGNGSEQRGPALVVIFPGVRYERKGGETNVAASKPPAPPKVGPAKH